MHTEPRSGGSPCRVVRESLAVNSAACSGRCRRPISASAIRRRRKISWRLGAAMMADHDDPKDGPDDEESGIPSAYTYLGQFVDHDLTFDPASSLQQQDDPDGLIDFRTPRFDLDNLYGKGPDDAPYLYHSNGQFILGRALTGASSNPNARDLPRSAPTSGRCGRHQRRPPRHYRRPPQRRERDRVAAPGALAAIPQQADVGGYRTCAQPLRARAKRSALSLSVDAGQRLPADHRLGKRVEGHHPASLQQHQCPGRSAAVALSSISCTSRPCRWNSPVRPIASAIRWCGRATA